MKAKAKAKVGGGGCLPPLPLDDYALTCADGFRLQSHNALDGSHLSPLFIRKGLHQQMQAASHLSK